MIPYNCADPDQYAQGMMAAREAIGRGQLIVIPTDTVYGVAANAFSPSAVSALLEAKGRGRDMPPPVLIGSRRTLDGLLRTVSEHVNTLADAFWPGALTIVAEHAPSLRWDIGDSRGTVAVRMPKHPIASDLLNHTGPLATSSANRTGHPPATTSQQAIDQLGPAITVYLDGGPSDNPVPSTIVDVTSDRPRVLRQGAISIDKIREVIPDLVLI